MSLAGKQHYERYKETYTTYRESHRDERNQYQRDYYIVNKDNILEWQKNTNKKTVIESMLKSHVRAEDITCQETARNI
jgi:hypothetical protein